MLNSKQFGRFVIPVMIAALVAGAATASSTTSKSGKASAKPAAKATTSAKPKFNTLAPKSPITISFASRIRQGNLVVSLDGTPIFNEAFEKPFFVISQTTTWDPVEIPTGKHKLSVKVHGKKKIYSSSIYDLEVSRKGMELLIKVEGDRLVVTPAS
jgi:hypothetical protein